MPETPDSWPRVVASRLPSRGNLLWERRKPSAAGSPFCLPAQAQARATHPARRKNAREAGQLNALREQLRGSRSGAGLRRLVQPPACLHPPRFFHTLAASAHVMSGKQPSKLSAHHP